MQFDFFHWNELTPAQHRRVTEHYGDLRPWLTIPRARPTMVLTAWEGSALVGMSLITHDRVSVSGAVIDVAAVRSLQIAASLPPSAAVELAMTHAATLFDEGIGILLLRGDVGIWSPHGFAPISYPTHTAWSQRPAPVQPQPGTVSIGYLDDELRGAIADIARARPLRSVAVVDRDSPAPAQWLVVRGRDGQLRAAAELQPVMGAVAQYAVSRAVAVDDGAALDTLDALWAHPDTTALSLALPLDHPLTRMAVFSGAATTFQAAAPQTLLAGIVDLPTMLTALIPAFRARVAASVYHDWVGGVRLEISDERAMVMLEQGSVSVIDGTREAAVRMRSIELPALAQLCFGYRSVSALRRAGLLQCDDTELPILDVLFPVLQPALSWDA